MRKLLRATLVACLFISLQSCVSFVAQSKTAFGDEDCSLPPYTYGGTITSILLFGTAVTEIAKEPALIIGGVMLLIDFPFTVALDTITLPISAARDVVACIKKYNEGALPSGDGEDVKLGQAIPLIFVQMNAPHEQLTINTHMVKLNFAQQ